MNKDKKINPEVKYYYSQFVNSNLYEQIKFADTKAALIFSVLGIATAAIVSRGIKIDWVQVNVSFIVILLGIAVILIIISLKSVFAVLYPRYNKSKRKGTFYFEDILNYNKNEYVNKGVSLSDNETAKELFEQSYVLADIVNRKFRAIRHAMITTAITLAYTVMILMLI